MSFCPKCGTQCPEGTKFCENCGNPIAAGAPAQNTASQNIPPQNIPPQYNSGYNQPNYGGYSSGIKTRGIAVSIILSIITCGIYGIYWMIKLNDEINELSGERNATSGGMVFLFTLITCGIYSFFWMYKMGERCDRIKGANGSSGILYLVLALFGLSIVDYCLMQDTINKAVS